LGSDLKLPGFEREVRKMRDGANYKLSLIAYYRLLFQINPGMARTFRNIEIQGFSQCSENNP
jgi:hypothetical protein